MHNKHIKNRPQKTWAGLATARLLCERYVCKEDNVKTAILLIAGLFLCSVAKAEEKRFGDWFVVRADNGDMVAGTQQDNFSKALVYRCFKELNKCAHVLIADIKCDDGYTYPVLVNSEHSALSMNTLCSDNDGKSELILTEFDQIHEIIQKSNVVGIAVPMASGQFKVVRFSLNGSSKAMSYAEGKLVDSAEYL